MKTIQDNIDYEREVQEICSVCTSQFSFKFKELDRYVTDCWRIRCPVCNSETRYKDIIVRSFIKEIENE